MTAPAAANLREQRRRVIIRSPRRRAAGNPAGGPVGSRHRQQLNSEFIAALLRDFRHGGPKAIERVRRAQPASYMKILALLVPREHKVEQMNTFEGLSTEQIEAYIAAIQDRLDRRAAGHQVIDGEAAEFYGGCDYHTPSA